MGKIGSLCGVEPLSRAMQSYPDHVVREWWAAALEVFRIHNAANVLVLVIKLDSCKDMRLGAAMILRTLGAAESQRDLLGHEFHWPIDMSENVHSL